MAYVQIKSAHLISPRRTPRLSRQLLVTLRKDAIHTVADGVACLVLEDKTCFRFVLQYVDLKEPFQRRSGLILATGTV